MGHEEARLVDLAGPHPLGGSADGLIGRGAVVSVRLKLALTVFATGIVTALLVLITVVFAFQRFEHETAYRRGTAFLSRVAATYDNLLEMHERQPDELRAWLRNMVLFEPDTQLYLLDLKGTVLASSGTVRLPSGFPAGPGVFKYNYNNSDCNAVVLSRETGGNNPPRYYA